MTAAIVAIIMVFSIPIVAILTSHSSSKNKLEHKMLQDQIELERLKHENYLLETEKMRLELEKMKIDGPKITLDK